MTYIIAYIVLLTLLIFGWKRYSDIQHDKVNDLSHVDMNEVEAPPDLRKSPLNK